MNSKLYLPLPLPLSLSLSPSLSLSLSPSLPLSPFSLSPSLPLPLPLPLPLSLSLSLSLYLYMVTIMEEYWCMKLSSAPRAATVLMFSIESTAIIPAFSRAFLFRAMFRLSIWLWRAPPTMRTGMTEIMKRVMTQE